MRTALFLCLILALAVGCGGAPERTIVEASAPTPLSVEEWKTLPVQEKYDPATFERIPLADPKLKSPAAWTKFETDVIQPEFKKDHPPAN